MKRRTFLASSAAAASAMVIPAKLSMALPSNGRSQDDGLGDRVYKTLKYGMVGVKGSLTEKFTAAKEAGLISN